MDREAAGKLHLLECILSDEASEPTYLPISLLKTITQDFSGNLQIGMGGFAAVYKGFLGNGKPVAVKKLFDSIDVDETKYNQEVGCLMRVRHKNIVRFLGYCADTQGEVQDYKGKFVIADVRHRLLCFEYLPNGSLQHYITDASHGLEWRKRYKILKGICRGLCHLHELRIVHLDLKPANILLDCNMVPKISDFGLSRCFDENQTSTITSRRCGSWGYLAPEFHNGVITFKLDIYSLGVIFTEILSGQKGYSSVDDVLKNWRNRFEISSADTLLEQVRVCAQISIDCRNLDPNKRPGIHRIIQILDETEEMATKEKACFGDLASEEMITVAAPEARPQALAPAVVVFRSKLPDIEIPSHLPLHEYCFARAVELPDAPCLIAAATGRTYTYAQTRLLCRKAAASLGGLGVRQGDAVMILLQNSVEFVLTFFGACFLGAVTTAANPFGTPQEIHKQLRASGARLVVTQSAFVDKLRHEAFPLTVVTTDDDAANKPEGCLEFWELVASADEAALPEVSISPDDPVTLPFTSAATGLSKGVVLTHGGQVSGVAQQVDGENPNLYMREGDVVLCVLPLFHIFTLNSVLLCALRAGAAVMLMPKFEMGAMLEGIQRWRVTVAAVVPPLVVALAKYPALEKYDLSSIRIVLCGAAPAPLVNDLVDALPQAIFGQGYWMTEAGPVLSMCPAFARDPSPAKPGSCGTVVRNAELKVVDPDTGLSLGRNRPGEICIRGPQIMKGYLNDPEATARAIDVDGWLHTGDIGFVDDDDEVVIVDHVKDVITYKGFKVAPAELQALLLTHPSIADAAVVPLKDHLAGEVPVAFVVRAAGSDIAADAINEFVSKQVVFYKRLHKVYIIDSIPLAPSGKLLRRELFAKLPAAATE